MTLRRRSSNIDWLTEWTRNNTFTKLLPSLNADTATVQSPVVASSVKSHIESQLREWSEKGNTKIKNKTLTERRQVTGRWYLLLHTHGGQFQMRCVNCKKMKFYIRLTKENTNMAALVVKFVLICLFIMNFNSFAAWKDFVFNIKRIITYKLPKVSRTHQTHTSFKKEMTQSK